MAMQDVLAAFPRRPLSVRPGRGAVGGWLLAIGGLLLFGGFIGLAVLKIVPEIRNDMMVQDAAQPAPQVQVTNGRCRSRLALLQDCEMTLSWRGKNGQGSRDVSYMFVEPHMGSWSVVPMMDPAQPELVSTDLGLERLTNRMLTVAGGVLFCLLLIAGLFLAAVRSQRKAGEARALSMRNLMPVPVRFAGWGQGPTWRVQDELGATFEWPVRKRDKPFVLDDANGLVLALRPAEGGPAFPLDEKLRVVNLTPEEKGRIVAARG